MHVLNIRSKYLHAVILGLFCFIAIGLGSIAFSNAHTASAQTSHNSSAISTQYLDFSALKVQVNDGTYPQYQRAYSPDIAYDEYGVLHAVWMDPRDGVNINRPYYSHSHDYGKTWSSNVQVSDDFEYVSENLPNIAACRHTVIVAWYVWQPSPTQYISVSTNDGKNWSDAIAVNPSPDIAQLTDDLIADPKTCQFHLFTSRGGGYGYRLNHTLISMDDGVPIIGVPSPVSSYGYTPDFGVSAHTTLDRNGNLHVVWADHRSGTRNIYYNMSADSGTTWGTDESITTPVVGEDNFMPTVAVGYVGMTISQQERIWVAWTGGDETNELLPYVSERLSSGWTSPVVVTHNGSGKFASEASVAIANKKLYVGWLDDWYGARGIKLAQSKDGLTWTGEKIMAVQTRWMENPSMVARADTNTIGFIYTDQPHVFFSRDYLVTPD